MSTLSSRVVSPERRRKGLKQEDMMMREVELFAPARDYFESIGADVYGEIGRYASVGAIDLIAKIGGAVIAVELKMSLSAAVIEQARENIRSSDFSYVGISTKPRKSSVDKCRACGVGIIRITDRAEIILDPNHRHAPIDRFKNHILSQLTPTNRGCVDGGLPTLKGVGPRIECAKRVSKYLVEHPEATWKEIYRDVPNHYCSYSSMRGAVRFDVDYPECRLESDTERGKGW